MSLACAGCNGPALGKLALRFYCLGHNAPAGWIISATPACGPCAKRTAAIDVASAEEIEEAARMTRITHGAEPENFVVCLKPLERVHMPDASIVPEEPVKPSLKEELERLWQEPIKGD